MIFLGKRTPNRMPHHMPNDCKVYRIDENMNITPLLHERSVRVHRFGEGFSWGYHGEGPSQLALALLLETTNNERLSYSLCQSFKVDFIAKIRTDCWAIDTTYIQEWIKQQTDEETQNVR